tara:strand:+ start:928 stop:1476 length:549 start_codon:yes stop_codon:yes gene_type:complete
MNWVAFFSQTGSEIVNISEEIGRWPDLIVTNRQGGYDKINPKISERLNAGKQRMLLVEKKPTVNRYHEAIRDGSIVTLHGWLRIVPEEICDKYEIYNGHPGLITEYPELKGKDPQVRAFEGKYKTAGSVIHEVVPEVDAGKILHEHAISIDGLTLDEVYSSLHDVSTNLWIDFLREKFNVAS